MMPERFDQLALSRRDVGLMVASGTAAAAGSGPASDFLLRQYQTLTETDAKIRDVSLVSGEIEQGGVLKVDILIENTGQKTISNLVTQMSVRLPDGFTYGPPSSTRTKLEAGERTIQQLTWSLPDDAKLGKWDLKTTIFSSAGKVFDGTDFNVSFNVHENVNPFWDVVSESLWAVLKGGVLGDFGVDWKVKHYNTFPYFIGWFAGSVAGPLDVVADARDCVAWDKNWSSNTLDCGGMIISAVGSAGTIVGGLGAIIPEGFTTAAGIGIMTVSIKLDKSEDATDAARIIKQYDDVGGNITKVNDFLTSKYPTDTVSSIADELPAGLSKKLEEVNDFKIFKSPIDREVIFPLGKYESKFAGQGGHIDEWPRIRKVLEKPNEIWKSDKGLYWFIRKTKDGNAYVIKATDLNKIEETAGWRIQPQTGYVRKYSKVIDDIPSEMRQIYKSVTN